MRFRIRWSTTARTLTLARTDRSRLRGIRGRQGIRGRDTPGEGGLGSNFLVFLDFFLVLWGKLLPCAPIVDRRKLRGLTAQCLIVSQSWGSRCSRGADPKVCASPPGPALANGISFPSQPGKPTRASAAVQGDRPTKNAN